MPLPVRHHRLLRLRARSRRTMALLALVASVGPSHAADFEWLSAGVRLRVGEQKVLGQQQPVSFNAVDATAMLRTPWNVSLSSDWVAEARLMASAGVLRGADKTALLLSALPVLAFDWSDGRFTLDLGAGLALISRHRYAEQDYGGPLQFALTFGVAVPVYERVTLGYRFMHYSDAGAYGRGTIGADFHMVELGYRF